MMKLFCLLCLIMLCGSAWATGPYQAKVELIQANQIGSAFNTVFLELNISDSPCSSTNSADRFTLTNEVQYSTALSALLADKDVVIFGTGQCVSNIEQISSIRILR